jgi:hypothetical protein
MHQLNEEQKELIRRHTESYKEWAQTKEGKDNLDEHREHNAFFVKKLSKDNIDKIDEAEFRELYKKLWASNIWSNKDWYIDNKLLKPNGLPKIKEELKKLLYGEEGIDARFDRFRENIQGFGPSYISEILHFVFPEKYCLWNDKPKTVLPILKINLLPERFFKYSLQSGEDYAKCIEVLELVKDELGNLGFKNPDFIDVDCLLWYIFNNTDFSETAKEVKEEIRPKEVKTAKQISSHEEMEYYLLKLGELLGYSTYTVDSSKVFNGVKLGDCAILKDIPDFTGQRDKNSAKEIDVIWFDEEGENPKFCLEVEHTTDITKGLNRLLQLEHFYVTFVIVAPEDKRAKFEIEMNKFPYRRLRERYKFISYDELLEFYEVAQSFRKLKDKLLG